MTKPATSRGLGAVEVIVAAAIVGVLILYLLISMPRGREAARRATCQRNLMQIGTAVGLYHQAVGQLPPVELDGPSPVAQMLNELKQPDFLGLTDRKTLPKPAAAPAGNRPVRGFICPSDNAASDGRHPSPISYRANTGDTSNGKGGPFSFGRTVRLGEVESAKGTGFVAAFSERLVGNGADDLASYLRVSGPVKSSGCPIPERPDWRNDAGVSWIESSYVSTLYNHAATPNARPTCVATDGKSATMGASSHHAEGVHVLMLDGAVRNYRPSVSLDIWQALATTGDAK
jgi:type II secretory pathway pseudopilin PulG